MTDDELKAIEVAANAPDEAWRGGSIPSARHDILSLIAEVRRLKTENERLKDESERWMLLAEAREPVK